MGKILFILDFKCSPCSGCCILSFGRFPGVWILCADVSEHVHLHMWCKQDSLLNHLWGCNEQSVPKRRDVQLDVGESPKKKEYRGANKSLARPGRKQTWKHVRDVRDFNQIETRALIKFLFLQGKTPKEIHAILTETLACRLLGRAKDLSAPLYKILFAALGILFLSLHQFSINLGSTGRYSFAPSSRVWVIQFLKNQRLANDFLWRTTQNFMEHPADGLVADKRSQTGSAHKRFFFTS